MCNGAEPRFRTHHRIAAIPPEFRNCEMQTIYFRCIEDGPEHPLAPIEAKFGKREISPYGTFNTAL